MDIFESWQTYVNHDTVRALIVKKTSMKLLKLPLPSQAKIINKNYHISGLLERLQEGGPIIRLFDSLAWSLVKPDCSWIMTISTK